VLYCNWANNTFAHTSISYILISSDLVLRQRLIHTVICFMTLCGLVGNCQNFGRLRPERFGRFVHNIGNRLYQTQGHLPEFQNLIIDRLTAPNPTTVSDFYSVALSRPWVIISTYVGNGRLNRNSCTQIQGKEQMRYETFMVLKVHFREVLNPYILV
jgi:hypothetical protein